MFVARSPLFDPTTGTGYGLRTTTDLFPAERRRRPGGAGSGRAAKLEVLGVLVGERANQRAACVLDERHLPRIRVEVNVHEVAGLDLIGRDEVRQREDQEPLDGSLE